MLINNNGNLCIKEVNSNSGTSGITRQGNRVDSDAVAVSAVETQQIVYKNHLLPIVHIGTQTKAIMDKVKNQ